MWLENVKVDEVIVSFCEKWIVVTTDKGSENFHLLLTKVLFFSACRRFVYSARFIQDALLY